MLNVKIEITDYYLLALVLLWGPCNQWAIGWKQDISAFENKDKTSQESQPKKVRDKNSDKYIVSLVFQCFVYANAI